MRRRYNFPRVERNRRKEEKKGPWFKKLNSNMRTRQMEREREELVGHALPFCVSGVSLFLENKKKKSIDERESQQG